jgi:hypothetical protein
MLSKLLPAWENLQGEAAGIDQIFHQLLPRTNTDLPYYFSTWAYNLKLTMMEEIMWLGFDLELYGQNEYIMTYW